MKPVRIQLRRTKGWRMPANTVKVDRSTKFGNPFQVNKHQPAAEVVEKFCDWLDGMLGDEFLARQMALIHALPQLRGKNLACWCKPGAPCHADVLLKIANQKIK